MDEKLLEELLAIEVKQVQEQIKALEVAFQLMVSALSADDETDKRYLAIARTQFEFAFSRSAAASSLSSTSTWGPDP